MIAEQKAKELIEKFKKHSHFDWNEFDGFNKETGEENAKACALICVDEILNAVCGYMPEGGTAMEVDNPQKYFWLETKSFIENS